MKDNHRFTTFVANPDRYGRFGHQTFSMLTAWALAALLDKRFVPLPYLYFSSHFNGYVDFSRSEYASTTTRGSTKIVHIRGLAKNDRYGNNKLPTSSMEGISELIKQISVAEEDCDGMELMAFLPFDQNIGILSRIINHKINDIREIFHFSDLRAAQAQPTEYKKIALHIRRGDVTQEKHPDWYVPIEIYEDLVQRILTLPIGDSKIFILTEGPSYDEGVTLLARKYGLQIGGLNGVASEYCCEQHPKDVVDFFELVSADVVIGSKSTYSWLASRIGSGKFISVLDSEQELPHNLKSEGTVVFNRSLVRISECRIEDCFR